MDVSMYRMGVAGVHLGTYLEYYLESMAGVEVVRLESIAFSGHYNRNSSTGHALAPYKPPPPTCNVRTQGGGSNRSRRVEIFPDPGWGASP